MHSVGAISARAQASRLNGARSRGPRTPEGKARSAGNALRHGLCAQRFVVLPDEDALGYQAHEAALVDELAPKGALQSILARRLAAAAWRLERTDRIEALLFEHHCGDRDADRTRDPRRSSSPCGLLRRAGPNGRTADPRPAASTTGQGCAGAAHADDIAPTQERHASASHPSVVSAPSSAFLQLPSAGFAKAPVRWQSGDKTKEK